MKEQQITHGVAVDLFLSMWTETGGDLDACVAALIDCRPRKKILPAEAAEVCLFFGLSQRQFMRGNHPVRARARRVASLMLRWQGWSYPKIGRMLQQDHTTVVHAVAEGLKDHDLVAVAGALMEQLAADGGRAAA